MFSRLDDVIALAGFFIFLTGVYLLAGLAITLILLGLILIYTGARIDIRAKQHEPDKATDTNL